MIVHTVSVSEFNDPCTRILSKYNSDLDHGSNLDTLHRTERHIGFRLDVVNVADALVLLYVAVC